MASGPADQVTDVTEVSSEQVWRFQMGRQHLTAREPESKVEDVIGRLGGLDARLDDAAELSLWARIRGIEEGVISRELWPDRSLLKTWAMDGALHLLPATEFPMWNGAIRARNQAQQGSVIRELSLDDSTVDSIVTSVGDLLSEATLTVEEISTGIDESLSNSSLAELTLAEWRVLLQIAAFEGKLCIVPRKDNRMRFTHPERWVGAFEEVEPVTGRNEVTVRYLRTYGPSTIEQFSRWMGIPESAGERWFQAVSDRIVRVDVEGSSGWLPRDAISGMMQAQPQQTVRLLPEFDPYIKGALQEPAMAVDQTYRKQVLGPNGWISPTLVVEGKIVGVWDYDHTPNDLDVTVAPFGSTPSWVRKEAWVEAVRLSEYFDSDLVFNWRPG